MKKTIKSIFLLLPLLLVFSCSSAQKNEAKIKGADAVAKEAKKQIMQTASTFEFPTLHKEFCATNVEIEAERLSLSIRDAVDKALKTEREKSQSGLMALSSSSILKMACHAAISDLAPKILLKDYEHYRCLLMVVTSKTDDLVCGKF